MKKKFFNILVAGLAFCGAAVCLSGCGKDKNGVSEVNSYVAISETELTDVTTEIEETTELIEEKTEAVLVATANDAINDNLVDFTSLDEDIKNAFLGVIIEKETQINYYNWQLGFENLTPDGKAIKSLLPVAVVDVTGDDIPELLMMTCDDKEANASLSIYMYNDNTKELDRIYNDVLDVCAAGGTSYFLFKKSGSNSLFGYRENLAQMSIADYFEFVVGEDGSIETKSLFGYVSNYDGNFEKVYEYNIDGTEATRNEFNNAKKDLYDNISMLVMYNHHWVSGEMFEDRLLSQIPHAFSTLEELKLNLQ